MLIKFVLSILFILGFTNSNINSKSNRLADPKSKEAAVYSVSAYTPSTLANMGTAFMVKYRGNTYLVSAGHVCEEFVTHPRVLFMLKDGDTYHTVDGFHIFKDDDVCVLDSMNIDRSNYLELDDGVDSLKINDVVHTIGFPGIPVNEMFGPVKIFESARIWGFETVDGDDWKNYPLYHVSLPIFGRPIIPGQSGSPILNAEGKVIGVLVLQNHNGLGLFTGIDKLKKYLDEARSK